MKIAIPKILFTLVLALLGIFNAQAQGTNDECSNPIIITDVTNWCSGTAAFTNVGATPSSYGAPSCWPSVGNDVWFSFTATATDVRIVVRGATAQSPGGTLINPQIALYLGTCGGVINQLECQNAPASSNIVEAYQGGLFVGSTYLFRIQGAGTATGTFQICIDNYNPVPDPQSDCPKAVILCDKSAFSVESVSGAGQNTGELADALCFNNGAPLNNESNSTWYVWKCSQSGTLTFTLTPLNAPDDLDFVIYLLPNGIGDCTGKQVVRCMASGDYVYPSPCMGPTGLKVGDPDIEEDAGCTDSGDDAWLKEFNMVAGETYALVVNNFTSTGNGFAIEFGGSGLFEGPDAKFTTVPQEICLGAVVNVSDASSFPLGSITKWNWSFGADAVPQVATGSGPHAVTFNIPGIHPVVMTIETDLGCKVTEIQNVLVHPDVEVDTVISTPECNGGTNGVITIDNIQMGTPPFQFSWENGPFTSNNSLSGLAVGTYNLVIRDANNCETELDIPVKELELTVAPQVTPPLCFGDENGQVQLEVTNGTAPYQFDWGAGFTPNNQQGGFGSGMYTVLGLDAELCKGTFNFTVTDNPVLELTMDTVNVTCFGANDGMATANPSGGVGNYTYAWSDGQTTQTATGLAPGQYSVTVYDGNECEIIGAVFITQPPDVGINLLGVKNIICNGDAAGVVYIEGFGGRPDYMYSADGINYVPGDSITNLLAGEYFIKIKDAGGCLDSVYAQITQPPALSVFAYPGDTTIDLGFQFQIQTFTQPANRPVSFLWTPATGLSCDDCHEPLVTAINDQLYVVKITDSTNCMAFDTVRVLVNKNRPIYIPNVIAPDANGPNDSFTLYGGPGAERIELLRIYDRWGELVYEAEDIPIGEASLGWRGTFRGKKAPTGVYTFYTYVRFLDQVVVQYEGNLTVVYGVKH